MALHSLKKEFAGRVKLIYIDPPYNTGNDSFNYNDSFNHSTWLVFMKNRLEIARELLKDDGVIFVQLDYNEVHYCKILMDEIFGRENFINEIIWKRKFGNANEQRRLGSAYDCILFYQKTNNFVINEVFELNSEHVQKYIKERFTRVDSDGINKDRKWMPYPLANPGLPTKNLIYEYKGYKAPPKGWRMVKEKLEELDKQGRLYFPIDKSQRIQEKKFLDEYKGQPIDALWTDIFVINSQAKEAINFIGQKPEALLQRIIEISTQENDIVLDFFAGSGTTAAVTMKMNRQFIAIEQMDYIETITKERLKNVIEGEQGGVSRALGWQGGGEFVYFELKKHNELFKEKIVKAKNKKEMLEIFKEIDNNAFLSYKVDMKKFSKNINEFEALSLEEQKRILDEFLDKNQLYVNLSSINDMDFKISYDEKEASASFYGERK